MNRKHGFLMPQAVSKDMVVQELDEEVLIYNLQTHKAMSLNRSLSCVWQLCDGKTSLTKASAVIAQRLQKKVSDEFIELALDTLRENNLLIEELGATVPPMFSGVSRRELIRRAAITSAIALPAVVSLAAPQALQAASQLRPLGDSCTTDAQCQSNCCTGICEVAAACIV